MNIKFSIIVPVYNRPDELDDLLKSLTLQDYEPAFQVLVIEDGSTISSEQIVNKYQNDLQINYFVKENTGPGNSRNFGMERASGSYFIIFDSDCFLPSHYLSEVEKVLKHRYTDFYGGPDTFDPSFSTMQKAINYAMTSVLTTGGMRGNKNSSSKFQPRSFNMGLSKKAFETSKGFSSQRYGEDIDLTFRLWEHHFESQFIENAFVYHKRRSSFKLFFRQTFNFGAARPILTKQYPRTAKITYWFPSLFILGLGASIIAFGFGYSYFLYFFVIYFTAIFIDSFIRNKSLSAAFLTLGATFIQFLGYGSGFLRTFFKLNIIRQPPALAFPEMFK